MKKFETLLTSDFRKNETTNNQQKVVQSNNKTFIHHLNIKCS